MPSRLDSPALQSGQIDGAAASIAAGSNRIFVLVAQWEVATNPNVSLECGGVAATRILHTTENTIGFDVFIWKESDIGSMSGALFNETAGTYVGSNLEWYTFTMGDVDQTTPNSTPVYSTGSSVSSQNVSANAADYSFLISGSATASGTFTGWGTGYTELIDGNLNGGQRTGMAEASAGRAAETATVTSSVAIGVFRVAQFGFFNVASTGQPASIRNRLHNQPLFGRGF